MKISIITVCLNSEATIKDAIDSVNNQTYLDIEHIIVDGVSKDRTLNIVMRSKGKNSRITRVISEPDSGLYDAMNKGVKLATGDIVGILNADDFYFNNEVLGRVAQSFEVNDIDACYGNLVYVERDNIGKIKRYWKAGEYEQRRLKYGWMPPHPTFFCKRDVYSKQGLFNLNFNIAADYEFMLRVLKRGIKIAYIDESLVYMRECGHSAKSLKQRIAGWSELYMAWRVNGFCVPIFMVVARILFKIQQYFIVCSAAKYK
ncbi:glycosyltransferase [Patescibacteria group bacterium]|nr:glycosyltransferase [Patescibacteria group bacterium]